MVDTRIAALKKRGARVNLETVTGDICNTTLSESSFDAIVCQQAIEHIHDLDALFATSFRLLKPGGRALFTNDDNVFNRAKFRERQKMWQRRDGDWSFINQLKNERPIENRDIEPYAVMRQKIVVQVIPGLSNSDVERSLNDRRVDSSEIAPLARSYRPGQKLPTPPDFSWCRNPVTGEYCERHLNPFELAEGLAAHGFKADVRHGFRKRPLSWLNGVHFASVNAMLFNYRAYFIILGSAGRRCHIDGNASCASRESCRCHRAVGFRFAQVLRRRTRAWPTTHL